MFIYFTVTYYTKINKHIYLMERIEHEKVNKNCT